MRRTMLLSLLAVATTLPVPRAQAGPLAATPLAITVQSDGTFDPPVLRVRDGDTVVWTLNDRRDAIVQSSAVASLVPWSDCLPPKPWDPADVNNLVGPMPEGASGVFALGPYAHDPGFQVTTAAQCAADDTVAVSPIGQDVLCATGTPGETMLETWRAGDITGVHIRPSWNQLQPTRDTWDFDALVRDLNRAVKNGKLYSLSIKAGKHGTPDWIFSTSWNEDTGEILPRDDPGPVTRLVFRDTADDDEEGCGALMSLGSPTEQAYQNLWGAMLTKVATLVKSRADWYRALAFIRISGANLFTAEARLPKNCKRQCGICNSEVWARAGYTRNGLYTFYEGQVNKLLELFPGKAISYQLIQAGFPRVSDSGCWIVGQDDAQTGEQAYTVCPTAGPFDVVVPGTLRLPGGTEQTTHIIDNAISRLGPLFHVQHNGLQVEPTPGTCVNYLNHPAVPHAGLHYIDSGPGCPNKWVLEAGVAGQLTGFQTNNAHGVLTPAHLDSALVNARDNTDAAYVEIYEQRHWEARRHEQNGTVQASGNTIGAWTDALAQRHRNQLVPLTGVPDPFPSTFSYTFHYDSTPAGRTVNYYNAGRCGPGHPTLGTIIIEPAAPPSL